MKTFFGGYWVWFQMKTTQGMKLKSEHNIKLDIIMDRFRSITSPKLSDPGFKYLDSKPN